MVIPVTTTMAVSATVPAEVKAKANESEGQ